MLDDSIWAKLYRAFIWTKIEFLNEQMYSKKLSRDLYTIAMSPIVNSVVIIISLIIIVLNTSCLALDRYPNPLRHKRPRSSI
jgi:hypothetical protein